MQGIIRGVSLLGDAFTHLCQAVRGCGQFPCQLAAGEDLGVGQDFKNIFKVVGQVGQTANTGHVGQTLDGVSGALGTEQCVGFMVDQYCLQLLLKLLDQHRQFVIQHFHQLWIDLAADLQGDFVGGSGFAFDVVR